jgi:hypothetical protein
MTSAGKSTATRTIRIDAEIAPRAALLAAAAARMGASEAAIEEVLTAPREQGAHLSDEELVNRMVERTHQLAAESDLTPLIATAIENASPEDFSRDTIPAPPPAPSAKAKKRGRRG